MGYPSSKTKPLVVVKAKPAAMPTAVLLRWGGPELSGRGASGVANPDLWVVKHG